MKSRRNRIVVMIVTVLLVLPVVSSGATLTVCSSGCDFTTIQAAHDAASSGDIIDVQEPIQTEYGISISKDLTIQGQGQSNTRIDADELVPRPRSNAHNFGNMNYAKSSCNKPLNVLIYGGSDLE